MFCCCGLFLAIVAVKCCSAGDGCALDFVVLSAVWAWLVGFAVDFEFLLEVSFAAIYVVVVADGAATALDGLF